MSLGTLGDHLDAGACPRTVGVVGVAMAYPPGSTHAVVEGYEFYLLGSEATVMACPATSPHSRAGIRDALGAAARCGAKSLEITVCPDHPGGDAALEELATMSAVALVEVFDILAVDLSGSAAATVSEPTDVDVVEVGSFEEVAAFERTSALGWGIRCRRRTTSAWPIAR